MIKSFRHRGLQRLYERGDRSRINPTLVDKVETALGLLDVAETPEAVNLPGYRLHPLRGDLRGFWSIRVSGNWRIIFRFDDRDVCDVDLVDYH
jgi:proteic killer suppression protein